MATVDVKGLSDVTWLYTPVMDESL